VLLRRQAIGPAIVGPQQRFRRNPKHPGRRTRV